MMKEQIIEILEDIQPEADYETCQTLIDDHILTSLDVLSLVAELEDEFDVTIPTVEIIPSILIQWMQLRQWLKDFRKRARNEVLRCTVISVGISSGSCIFI